MNFKSINIKKAVLASVLLGSVAITGCKKSFLKPDPLSFYEPGTTFSTRSGLDAAIAICDRHLRSYWTYYESRTFGLPISTEYMFSDMAVASKTDDGNIFADIATRLTPTNGMEQGDVNMLGFFWKETYYGIKYANAVTTYIKNVKDMDDATRKEYIGRAYFHRAYRYLALAFQFKDVPLVTRIIEVPKQNYKSTTQEAILQMITRDMEDAVQWVPEQSKMSYIGMVNKGACRQLLIKCYLATGQWDKAIDQANILINSSGYTLMTAPFGTFESPLQSTWPITRNVIWDLHRPVNKSIAGNTEVILTMPNRNGSDAGIFMRSMRNWGPFWNNNALVSPAGKFMQSYALNSPSYDKNLDYNSGVGRGIGIIRPTYFAQHSMWTVNGVEDVADLRHNSKVGNWARMDSLKYNDVTDKQYYGKNVRLYDGTKLLCTDTVRNWFDWPHYKTYVPDLEFTSNVGSNNNQGGAGDWYCYRLAETYLLRAEALFYKGDIAGATSDVNAVRRRAQCSQLYTSVNIGDIVNERGRELWMEEWRHTELVRISYCLALSGKADEWGKTYDPKKLSENSYWYQRVMNYNDFYNKNKVVVRGRSYTIAPYNIYFPIPQSSIDANLYAKLSQNLGYDGYNAATDKWTKWEDAIADEDTH